MPHITHIKVGAVDYAPTVDELRDAVKKFREKRICAFDYRVKIDTLQVSPLQSVAVPIKFFLFVGSKVWQPTDEELKDLEDTFTDAFANIESNPVIATRHDVKVQIDFDYTNLEDNKEEHELNSQ